MPDPKTPQNPSRASKPRVLVVDDQVSMAEMVADGLAQYGYEATAVGSSREASERIQGGAYDVLVTDLRMPHIDGLGLLALSKKISPEKPVIIMTAFSAVDSAIESIRQGAYHYLTKPFKTDELALFLERALEESRLRRETQVLKRALRDRFSFSNIVGQSGVMQQVFEVIERVTDTTTPILILGETGTGKGLVARAIHSQGNRAEGPFVAINCAALPEHLLESELFGHVKGAFTGATSSRIGLFEEADGGTLLLDEIGEMAPKLQAKLLHVLESGSVRAVGANHERTIDVRVIAATHQDLRERALSGEFREDLLYRLDVVTLEIPPLRLRREDIPELVKHFLAEARGRHLTSPVRRLSAQALERLVRYSWPGNVRELEHLVERLVLLGQKEQIDVSELPERLSSPPKATLDFSGQILPIKDLQRQYATWAYEQLDGRKKLTAETLGVDFKTLSKWLGESTDPESND